MASTAGRIYSDILTYGPGVKVIAGNILFGSSSAVTSYKGKGFTVAKTSTGVWTVTLAVPYLAMLSYQCQLSAATASVLTPQFGAIDVTTAKTVVIRLNSTATETDPVSGDSISFVLLLATSSLNR